MTIVETAVWIDYLADRSTPWTEWVDRNRQVEELGLTDLIFCEVLQGFDQGKKFEQIRLRLMTMPIFPRGGQEMALAAARNYSFLRTKGVTVRKIIDCFTATLCITENFSLLHNDRDYDGFEKHLRLKVVHP